MSDMRVTLWGRDEDGNQEVDGVVVWDGHHIRLEPAKGHYDLRFVMHPILAHEEGVMKEYDPKKDPEGFMRNLCNKFNGSAFRASRVETVPDKTQDNIPADVLEAVLQEALNEKPV